MSMEEFNHHGLENAINRANRLRLALRNWIQDNPENELIDADLNELTT